MEQIVPSLVVHGDCLIASGGNNSHTVVAIRPPKGDQPPETRWESTRGGTWVSSPVCLDGLLFSITKVGVLFCREVDSGNIIWSRRLRGSFLASLVAGAGKVYALNENGEMFVMAATRQEQLLAENRLDEDGVCAATPALADGCLFVRTGKHLVCIGGIKP
ncbi:MAG: PQQ-binding-like beta-propeller repeat protein [Gemmatales bacterium]